MGLRMRVLTVGEVIGGDLCAAHWPATLLGDLRSQVRAHGVEARKENVVLWGLGLGVHRNSLRA